MEYIIPLLFVLGLVDQVLTTRLEEPRHMHVAELLARKQVRAWRAVVRVSGGVLLIGVLTYIFWRTL